MRGEESLFRVKIIYTLFFISCVLGGEKVGVDHTTLFNCGAFFFFIRRALVGTSDRLTSEDYNSSERLEGRENSVRLCAT